MTLVFPKKHTLKMMNVNGPLEDHLEIGFQLTIFND